MKEEIEFLWQHMRGDFGWLMAAVSWVTAARLMFKPLTSFFSQYIASVGETDGKWAVVLMRHPAYKFVAFFIDYIASVKLPAAKPAGPPPAPATPLTHASRLP